MNYESVILELLSRIQILEKKVEVLELRDTEEKNETSKEIELEDEQEQETVLENGKKISRSVARELAIHQLRHLNKDFAFEVANREDGSGIVAKSKDGKQKFIIKFLFSKSFVDGNSVVSNGERLPHSWHTLTREDVQNDKFDFFLFSCFVKEDIHQGDPFKWFMFSKDEIRQYVKSKITDSTGKYHFYFVDDSGLSRSRGLRIIETREEIQNVSEYYLKLELLNR